MATLTPTTDLKSRTNDTGLILVLKMFVHSFRPQRWYGNIVVAMVTGEPPKLIGGDRILRGACLECDEIAKEILATGSWCMVVRDLTVLVHS